jgi:L-amino acid N-acyltransferase YncA
VIGERTMVRPATAGDGPALTALVQSAASRRELSHRDGPMTPAAAAALVPDHPPRFVTLVATVDATLAGCALVARLYPRTAWDCTADVTVLVDPDHRRRGIGTALVRAVCGHAEASGLRSLIAVLRNRPDWLHHWSEREGFTRVGSLPFGDGGDVEPGELVFRQALVGERRS